MWKDRQRIYHERVGICDRVDTAGYLHQCFAITYFDYEWSGLMYPAKSYAVAYIYALLIEHYFGDDARQVLADPSLLYDNDKHFVPYNETTSAVYDEMFDNVSVTDILTSTILQVAKTVEWFKKEMLLL